MFVCGNSLLFRFVLFFFLFFLNGWYPSFLSTFHFADLVWFYLSYVEWCRVFLVCDVSADLVGVVFFGYRNLEPRGILVYVSDRCGMTFNAVNYSCFLLILLGVWCFLGVRVSYSL